jgi:hypothetical protein
LRHGLLLSDFGGGAKRDPFFSRKKFLQFPPPAMIIRAGGQMLTQPPLGPKPVPHHQVLNL